MTSTTTGCEMDVKVITEESLAVMLLPYDAKIVRQVRRGEYVLSFPDPCSATVFYRDMLDAEPPIAEECCLTAPIYSFEDLVHVRLMLAQYYIPIHVDPLMDNSPSTVWGF